MATPFQRSASMPEEIGPYRVEEPIARGGMGEVYRGYDARLDRPVALKRVRTDPQNPAQARERFRREARALARVRHPAVVEVYDWIEGEDGDWIVMELLEGRSLRSRIEQGPLELRRAVEIARDIAAGLAAVHAHGIVHRDLKPDNVMLVPPGEPESTTRGHTSAGYASASRVKILDFGLAKRVASMDGLTLTETISKEGQILGTVRFMSPEQAAGRGVDPRSDTFSLGVILYEMLTGIPPFGGDNAVETLTRICTVAEKPVHQLDPAVPEAVSELVRRMLKKEPERRLQSAAEVAEALDSLAAGLAAGRPDAELRAALPATESDSDVTSATWIAEETTIAPWTSQAGMAQTGTAALSGSHVRTLLLNDLVDSTKLVEKLGDERAAEIFEQHDRTARDLLQTNSGREIDKSDGFLMLFERPIDAVRFALGYHAALAEISEQEGVEVSSRVGIHVGEVVLRVNSAEDIARGAKPLEVEGLAKAMAARFMSLAGARQTLISRGVHDLGKRAAVGATDLPDGLRWVEHGRYRMKGVEEPVEVFEVGVETSSPLTRPVDTKKVRRVEEEKGVFLTHRRLRWLAAAVLLAAVGSGLFWWWRAPEPLEIAVLAPQAGAVDDSVDGALVAAAIRGALSRRLIGLEAVSLTPNDLVDAVQGSSIEIAKALAVDEVVTASFDCATRLCQISLSRISGAGGDILWGSSFSSRVDDFLKLHNAVEQNFRRGFADRRVESGSTDLEVRAEDYAAYLELYAEALEKDRDHSPADLLAEIRKIQQSSPRFLEAHMLEAIVAIVHFYDTRDEGLKRAAFDACNKAHELAPENPLPLIVLADAALDAGDQEVLESTIEKLETVAGGHPRVQALEALLLERRGQTEQALELMRQARELLPSVNLNRYLAMMEYRQGNSSRARDLFEQILDLQPDDFTIRLNLANVELSSGDPERAVELFEELVDHSAEVGSIMNLGVAYMLTERWQHANEAFERADVMAPDLPGLLLNLADTELLMGRHDEAQAHYREIVTRLDSDPNAVGGVVWQGLTVKGQALAHLGESEAAVLAAQEALRLAGDNPQVAVEAATIYALVGERASALVNVQRALEAGVDARWFAFPWFDELRASPRFQELFREAEAAR